LYRLQPRSPCAWLLNLKYSPAHLVGIQYPDTNTSGFDDFRLDITAASPMISKPNIPPREQTRQISASIRLDEATATQVDQYAAFIHLTADDVVDKALNYVFSKGRNFEEFLKTSLSGQEAPSLRIRKAPLRMLSNLVRTSRRRGGFRYTRAWTKSVNHVEIHWQSHNGAAHRKKIDTPPLVGSCLASCGS
jgi:hypothetical protein